MVPRIYSQNYVFRISTMLLFLFFSITSFGQAPPMFTGGCPAGQAATITLPAGGGVVTFTSTNIPALFGVTATDPDMAAGVTIEYSASIPSVNCPDVGTFLVTITATEVGSTDGSTNCDVMLTVEDGGPLAISLPTFNAVLDGTGMVTVTANDIDNGSSSCPGSVPPLMLSIVEASTFNCTNIGTPITLTLQATSAGLTSTSTTVVTVVDNINPMITPGTAQGDIAQNNDPGTCGAVVTYTTPTFDDNCGGNGQAATAMTGPASGSIFPVGTTTVTHSFTDAGGNTAMQSFDVVITDNEAPTVTPGTAQGNILINTNSPTLCGAVVTYTTPTFDDNCGGTEQTATTMTGLGSGTTFPLGSTLVTHSFADAAGTIVTHSFTVTVTDDDAPTVLTPTTNITVNNDPGMCSAVVNYTAPTFDDNCDMPITGTLTSGPASGSAFPVGTTTVTYSATDAAGNGPITSSFTVTVNDTEPPSAAAGNPGNQTQNNDTGVCQATVSWPSISLTADNCPGSVTVVYTTTDPKMGTVNILTATQSGNLVDFGDFPVGTTTVNFTVTDGAGNTDMGTFDVTVEDNEAPVVACPSTQTLHFANCDATVMVPDYRGLGNITDNCPFGYTVTQSPAAGDLISSIAGITPANGESFPVTITVTDNNASAANTGTSCTFTVTLDQDNEPVPSVGGAVLTSSNGGCGPFTIPAPTAVDACGNLICGVPFPPVAIDLGPVCGSNPSPCTPASRTLSPGAAIPDLNATGLTSTINVAGADPVIDDLNVTLNITHTWVGDLQATLTSPSGTVVQLFNRPGTPPGAVGCAGDDLAVTFDDAAANTAADFEGTCNNLPAISGSFQAIVPLAMFNNENPNGAWTLNITDGALGDTGTLDDWTLDFCLKTVGTSITNYQFPVGTHNITWNYDDGNGNISSQQQQIIVTEDIQAPTFNCQDITVQLDASGNATVVPGDVLESASISLTSGNNGSGALGNTLYTITTPVATTFSFDWDFNNPDPGFELFGYFLNGAGVLLSNQNETGSTTVALNAGDEFSFVAQSFDNTFGAATVTITNFSPGFSGDFGLSNWVFSNQNADGSFSSAPGEAADNCTPAANLTYALSQSIFDCTDVGTNTVTLTVTDMAGNSSTCDPVITVLDNIFPTLSGIPADVTVDCNSIPMASTAVTANDNCDTIGIIYNQTTTQLTNPALCGFYTYQITRTWSVADPSGNTTTNSQVITVQDIQDPIFATANFPSTVTVNASANSCDANVPLEMTAADVLDLPGCVAFANLTITNDGNGAGNANASGTYPIGSTPVTYTVTDPCGNANSYTVNVNVVDNTAPIATCKNNIAVVIPAGQDSLIINPSLIDNGSFDNCPGTVSLSVSPNVFYCNQADGVTAYPITLTVQANGQTSTCETTIIIQDNTAPVAVCNDTTIVFLDQTGNATITVADVDGGSFDNCSGILSTSISGQTSFTTADIGFYPATDQLVTLTVQDSNLNTATCSPAVLVSPPITCFTVDNNFLAGTGNNGVPLNTTNFVNVNGFQFTLEIDTLVASFTAVSNVNQAIVDNGVLTVQVLGSGDTLSISWFNTSGTPLTLNTATLFEININVIGAVGTVSDINFINAPTPSDVIVRYGNDIFSSSNGFPPCTVDGDIIVSPFATLPISGNVRTWGITRMDTTITVNNTDPNNPTMDTTITPVVIVPVQNVANVNIAKTEIDPFPTDTLFTFNAATTDINGNYIAQVSNVAGGIDKLFLDPSKDTNWLNSAGPGLADVASSDLFFIQQHIVGNILFTSIFEYLAADVNQDGEVSTLDLVLIQDVILNPEGSTSPSIVLTTFSPWRFIPAKDSIETIPLPVFPFTNFIPAGIQTADTIEFQNYSTPTTNVDWIAIKIGQVFGTLNPSLFTSTIVDTRTGEDFVMNVENQKVTEDELISIPVYAKDYAAFIAWQFTLEFDENSLEFESFIPGAITSFQEGGLGLNAEDEGIIGASWYGTPIEVADDEVLFTLQFRALENAAALSGLINVSSRIVHSESSLMSGAIGNVSLEFFTPTTTTVNTDFALHQNRPNPFNGETLVSFNLPKAGFAKVTISDLSGRILKVIEGDYAKGYNEVRIQSNELSSTGVLYYQLESAEHTATKKMIILD